MAISRDAATKYNGASDNSSSSSYNHTVAAGATMLVVCIQNGDNRTVDTVTYNGTSMTKQCDQSSSATFRSTIWTLASPASGTHAVAITFSGACYKMSQASSWLGTSTAGIGTSGTATSGSSTHPTKSVTTTVPGSVLVDGMLVNHNSGGITQDSPQVLNGTDYNTTYTFNGGSSYLPTTTVGSYTMGWTFSSGDDSDLCVIELIPTARFWVGGAASWDGTAGSKWALTSGGAGGQAVPTATDTVVFDANSGTNTVTIATTTALCDNVDFTGFTGTLAGSTAWTISGSAKFASTQITPTYSGTITFNATATGKTVTSAGKFPSSATLTFNGVGGGWTLQDDLTIGATKTLTLTAGTLDTNTKHVTCGALVISGSTTRTFTCTSSTITVNGTGTTPIDFTTSTNLTYNKTGSTIEYTDTSALTGNRTFAFGSLTHGTVTLNLNADTTASSFFKNSLTGAATFNALTFTGQGTGEASILVPSFTVTNAFTVTGTATNRVFVFGNSDLTNRLVTTNTPVTITAGSVTLSYVDFCNVAGAGAASPFTGTSLGNYGQGNTGITFTTPVTRYWVGNGGSASDTARWSTAHNGSSGATAPLAQDTIIIDSTSITSGSQTIQWDLGHLGSSFDASGVLNNPVFDVNDTSRSRRPLKSIAGGASGVFAGGGVNMPSGPTLTGASGRWFIVFAAANAASVNFTWSTATGLIDACQIEGDGSTTTLAGNIDLKASTTTFNLRGGTLNTNGFSITCTSSSLAVDAPAGKSVTLTLGSSVITTKGLSIADTGTTTINANTSEIICSVVGSTITLGTSKTYNKLTFSGTSGTYAPTCTTGATIGTMTLSGVGIVTYSFQTSRTWTITTLVASGTVSAYRTLQSSSAGTLATVNVTNAPTVQYCKIRDINASGGGTWYATMSLPTTNNNKNVLFSAPAILMGLVGR